MIHENQGNNLLPLKMLSTNLHLDHESKDWTLDRNKDDVEQRTHITEVVFEDAFSQPPLVQVSLVGFDIDNRDSARILARATDVTPYGFKVVVETRMHTRIYAVDVSWLAIGH